MRRLKVICFCLALTSWLAGSADAQTYTEFEFDGQKVMARPVAFKDSHITLGFQGGGTTNVPWGRLSQASLQKLLLVKNFREYATPFIHDVPRQDPPQGPKITIKEPERMARPSRGSLFASPVMYLVLFVLYVANIYAGFEIAQYRQRSPALVCCLSAVVPVLVPVIFLSMPESAPQEVVEEGAPPEEVPQAVVGEETPATAMVEQPDQAAGSTESTVPPETAPPTPEVPPQEETVYRRGQFTFNRRFFETKLAGFLKVVPGEAEKDMVIAISSARGNYVGPRLTRVSPNDLTLHVVKGGASQDVIIPFGEINEVKIRHKDAR